jgi:two-component system, OmpR family, response regulator
MRVLLVEDEEALAETLAAGLRADGFAIDIARDGVQALARIQSTEYDAMILDIMLPGPSGYEVVRRLRSEGVWVPVLMLTAKDGEYDEADALDLGADDYLTDQTVFVCRIASGVSFK